MALLQSKTILNNNLPHSTYILFIYDTGKNLETLVVSTLTGVFQKSEIIEFFLRETNSGKVFFPEFYSEHYL